MKIVVSIFLNQDFEKLKEKIKKAKKSGTDVVEVRADSYPKITEKDLMRLKGISGELKTPMIFTLRNKREGGKYNFSFERKLALIKRAIALNFDYLDIELKFLEKLKKIVPDLKGNSKTKIILSYHNLKGTESLEELRKIKKRMLNFEPEVIKIAIFSKGAKTNRDVLKLIKETKENIIGIPLGEKGKIARLKSISKNYFSYFCLNKKEKTAPGQISLAELRRTGLRHSFKNGKGN